MTKRARGLWMMMHSLMILVLTLQIDMAVIMKVLLEMLRRLVFFYAFSDVTLGIFVGVINCNCG